jgi:acetyl esterase/lipase
MLDFDSDWFRRGSAAVGAPNPFLRPDSDFPSEAELRAKIATLAAGPVASEGGADRMGVFGGLARLGLLYELFDPEGKLQGEIGVWPMRRVKAGERLPSRVWVMHGDADSAVPLEGSRVFCAEATKAAVGTEVRLDVMPGLEHVFDAEPSAAQMISEATAWLAETWLAEED